MNLFRPLALSCCLAAGGCSAQSVSEAIKLRSVYQGQYCEAESAGMRWLSEDAFARLVRGPGGGQHLNGPATTPPVIAKDERLLQVNLGQKNSGGYAVALSAEQAPVRQGVLILPLDIQQPAPDSMQTMQLTSPCLVVALSAGSYSRVRGEGIGEVEMDL